MPFELSGHLRMPGKKGAGSAGRHLRIHGIRWGEILVDSPRTRCCSGDSLRAGRRPCCVEAGLTAWFHIRRQEPVQARLSWNLTLCRFKMNDHPCASRKRRRVLSVGARLRSELEEAGIIRFGKGRHGPDIFWGRPDVPVLKPKLT